MLDELPFAKPRSYADPRNLKSYRSRHPRCEVLGCNRPACPEPHHLVPRARGRDDRDENLASLCLGCHSAWHQLGGREWLRRNDGKLAPELREKVRTALRIDD